MNNANLRPSSGPIGVVASLATGFDRVAARPVLILPPLLLDLFLWLGPRLNIAPLLERLARGMMPPPGSSQGLIQWLEDVTASLRDLGGRFNLLMTLSARPAGIPSWIVFSKPATSPVAFFDQIVLENSLLIGGLWLMITILGVGLGAVYHRAIARSVAPEAELPSGLWAWSQMLLLVATAYGGLLILALIGMLLMVLAGAVWMWLGLSTGFIAFSLLFWLVVYLSFTPHGIIRYRLGVVQAMIESAFVVRWNFLATVAFLGTLILISWLTNLVWGLAQPQSWFGMLSIVGHAFVSGTLVASSYAFYQGRREWLIRRRDEIEARMQRLEEEAKSHFRGDEQGDK